MESVITSFHNNIHYKFKLSSSCIFNRSNSNSKNNVFFSKTLIRKPITCSSLSSALALDNNDSTIHTTLLVESYHEHQSLNALIQRLKKKDSCPLQILQHDEDWSKDHFWLVINFLKNSSRSNQILQVLSLFLTLPL